ncbi:MULTISPECIES: carbon storage regulator CsrA [Helicobacter]|uniref:Translational regulator CsrA n=1 Tax=Helicobacter ganmani TaxID=60246 RepID=A0A3D8IH14_9HELI|nr:MULTISPECIES: carbon storage regulator CsrA [Helicobacter]RDU64413.1 carbon storage regulator [Helicobacter ganmani]
MLILSRKENESITIGENITIKVISIDKGNVKIGFDAPPELLILREELKLAISEENKKSLQQQAQSSVLDKLVAARKKA